jgi:hypothetical protein
MRTTVLLMFLKIPLQLFERDGSRISYERASVIARRRRGLLRVSSSPPSREGEQKDGGQCDQAAFVLSHNQPRYSDYHHSAHLRLPPCAIRAAASITRAPTATEPPNLGANRNNYNSPNTDRRFRRRTSTRQLQILASSTSLFCLAIRASEPPIRPTLHTVICLNSAAGFRSQRRPAHRPKRFETSEVGSLSKSNR